MRFCRRVVPPPADIESTLPQLGLVGSVRAIAVHVAVRAHPEVAVDLDWCGNCHSARNLYPVIGRHVLPDLTRAVGCQHGSVRRGSDIGGIAPNLRPAASVVVPDISGTYGEVVIVARSE